MLSKPKLYQIFTLMIRKPQKEAATGQFMVHLFFPFRNKYYLLMILFVHPSIYLVRICFFLLCFFFFFRKVEGRERFHILFVLRLPTFPSSPTPSHSPPHLPILMRWCRDKRLILSKHFRQSLKICFILCQYQYDGFITYGLRGDLCKSGPRYFASEKSFSQTLPNKLSLVARK